MKWLFLQRVNGITWGPNEVIGRFSGILVAYTHYSGTHIWWGSIVLHFIPKHWHHSLSSQSLGLFTKTPLWGSFSSKKFDHLKFSSQNFESCCWILFSRCVSSVKVISTAGILRKSALGPIFQSAEQTGHAGSSKQRVVEDMSANRTTKRAE